MHIRISKLLEMYPYLQSRAYSKADMGAIDTIIDIDVAIERVNLSKEEYKVLHHIFILDYTQMQAAEALGLTRGGLRYHIKSILSKVGKAYYRPEEV